MTSSKLGLCLRYFKGKLKHFNAWNNDAFCANSRRECSLTKFTRVCQGQCQVSAISCWQLVLSVNILSFWIFFRVALTTVSNWLRNTINHISVLSVLILISGIITSVQLILRVCCVCFDKSMPAWMIENVWAFPQNPSCQSFTYVRKLQATAVPNFVLLNILLFFLLSSVAVGGGNYAGRRGWIGFKSWQVNKIVSEKRWLSSDPYFKAGDLSSLVCQPYGPLLKGRVVLC